MCSAVQVLGPSLQCSLQQGCAEKALHEQNQQAPHGHLSSGECSCILDHLFYRSMYTLGQIKSILASPGLVSGRNVVFGVWLVGFRAAEYNDFLFTELMLKCFIKCHLV